MNTADFQLNAAATSCFKKSVPNCTSPDPTVYVNVTSTGNTSACVFALKMVWGDGETTTDEFAGGGDGAIIKQVKHTYKKPKPFLAPKTYPLTWDVSVRSGNCYGGSGPLSFTRTCAKTSLSGSAWAAKFPGSKSLDDLAPGFREKVKAFNAAMDAAGVTVKPKATYRPAERAYMMHYAWQVWKKAVPANKVPAFKPAKGQSAVDICWQHTDANGKFDSAASVAAADRMVGALGLDRTNKLAPSLNTLHTPRLAIDMTTTWAANSITITDKTGTRVKIATTPRTGMNTKLWAVGKTYGVIHFSPAAKDKNHWSYNGH
ncbi:hypothetical protein ACWCQL_36135 [Streptomyces sp. NPDC002073]